MADWISLREYSRRRNVTLGAVQNRLGSTINNLAIQVENLSAAESRIRDVDVAYETAQLTRNNILQQASISVLSQANALRAGHLTLSAADHDPFFLPFLSGVDGDRVVAYFGAFGLACFTASGEKCEKSSFPITLSHFTKYDSGLPPRFRTRPSFSRRSTRASQGCTGERSCTLGTCPTTPPRRACAPRSKRTVAR